LKKPEKKWIAVLALLAGMAWGAGATPHQAAPAPHATLISGG
jgi:hypothetical protein